ncbi:MAG TPA: GDP-mannose 4,6-dehydratase [Gemmatimonadaceae bacterium]|nr:GDP-mannose 4,6-dehydratase [Gemmatimonadaceae bacterium]
MSGKPRALITGITGQDGFYLTRLLLEKGYEVHGVVRRGQNPDLPVGVGVHLGDLTDPATIYQAITDSDPSEIYNLGAQSHVGASFKEASYTFRATAEPILTILECLRANGGAARGVRVYQASSSEMFGDAPAPQNENSPFRPQSPYAVAKVAAHHTVSLYRKAYGLFVVGGILFNHEGPRRPPSFVTRKITRGVARIFSGNDDSLTLGNLDACRDWGFAGDYVKAMWLMLQQDTPKDYIVATGNTHSVRDFVIAAFDHANRLTGRNLQWEMFVKTSADLQRPSEVPHLLGNASRTCQELGWAPEVNFDGLVRMMVEADLEDHGVALIRATG